MRVAVPADSAPSKHKLQDGAPRSASRQYSVDVSADALPPALRGRSVSMEIVYDPRANAMLETTTIDRCAYAKFA